jgi:hypothetical protein
MTTLLLSLLVLAVAAGAAVLLWPAGHVEVYRISQADFIDEPTDTDLKEAA